MKYQWCASILISISLLLSPIAAYADQGAVEQDSTEWWKQNGHEIQISKQGNEASDFAFLKPLLKEKKVVSLGENFHRVKEYSSVKVQMIKYLHEELGYNVIAFESGMGDAEAVRYYQDQFDSASMMGLSIFPVWHSQETVELFDYIKEQAAGDHPLYLAGYDMQFNSYFLSNVIAEAMKKLDEKQAQQFKDTDLNAINELYQIINQYGLLEDSKDKQSYIRATKSLINKYVPKYKQSIKFMKDNYKELAALYPNDPHFINIMIRSMYDRISFMRMVLLEDKESYAYRDEFMLNNLQYLMKTVYPDQKFILWAHNDHLSKNTSKVEILEKGKWTNSFSSMGEMLHKQLQDQLYVIGLYMNQGSSVAITTMTPFQIAPRPVGSLEHIIMQSGYKNTFVDLSKQSKKDAFNAWMFEPVYASEDGLTDEVIRTNVMKFIPREQYDGIIVVDEVNAPTLLESQTTEMKQ